MLVKKWSESRAALQVLHVEKLRSTQSFTHGRAGGFLGLKQASSPVCLFGYVSTAPGSRTPLWCFHKQCVVLMEII